MNYPGARPKFSALVTSDRLWRVDETGDGTPLDRRLAMSGHERPRTVASLLEEVPLGQRVPLLAIGSNAAPSQLRHKFRETPGQLCSLSMRARAVGLVPGFAPFRAPGGYLPATPILEWDAAVSDVTIQFVSQVELQRLDETESRWYRRVWLDASVAEISLRTRERLNGVHAYVAEHGYLCDGREPMVKGHVGEPAPSGVRQHRFASDQRTAIQWLLDRSELGVQFTAPEEFSSAQMTIEQSFELIRRTRLWKDSNQLGRLPDLARLP